MGPADSGRCELSGKIWFVQCTALSGVTVSLRGQNNDFVGSNYLEFEGTKNQDLGGPNNDFWGTKRVFVPQKRNLRGPNNTFGGTNDFEFDGTKQ